MTISYLINYKQLYFIYDMILYAVYYRIYSCWVIIFDFMWRVLSSIVSIYCIQFNSFVLFFHKLHNFTQVIIFTRFFLFGIHICNSVLLL